MTHTHIEKWNNGRAWLWDWLYIEWSAPTSHLMFHVRFWDGDSDRDIGISLGTKLFYLHIGFENILRKYRESRTVGVSYHDAALWLHTWVTDDWHSKAPWYTKVIAIHMPWDAEWVRTSLLMADGTWEHEVPGVRKEFWRDEWKEKCFHETHPYSYTRRNGEVQEVKATIKVEEREWRPKWFKWTKMFAHVRRTIDVKFSDEVGEGVDSWKGGVLGCGYDLLPDETPAQCLFRMEFERNFHR